jgi:hypothetical protein
MRTGIDPGEYFVREDSGLLGLIRESPLKIP